VRDDIIANRDKLSKLTDNKYDQIIQFITELRPRQSELFQFLGEKEAKHYIIVLQNSAEQRPNGWFFWSFAILTIKQSTITNFHIIDSYFPQKYFPDMMVRLPERSRSLYPLNTSTWIAANKFWFHDLDGQTIIALYNETFNNPHAPELLPDDICKDLCNQHIDGVVFLQTKLIQQLLPSFQQIQREWQFLNATINIIRWANLPNKKEKYIAQAKELFTQQLWTLIKQSISQFEHLTSQSYIGIYLPQASDSFKQLLSDYSLFISPYFNTTSKNNGSAQSKAIYLRDTNTSQDKIDDFVTKTIQVANTFWDVLIEQSDNNLLYIDQLAPGKYTLTIHYQITIPEQYKEYIRELEQRYTITMTDREQGILWLIPTDHYDDKITRLRATRSHIYYPKRVDLTVQWWYGFWFATADTPRWDRILQYKLETSQNNSESSVRLNMTIEQ